jgi:hypothetical protein
MFWSPLSTAKLMRLLQGIALKNAKARPLPEAQLIKCVEEDRVGLLGFQWQLRQLEPWAMV